MIVNIHLQVFINFKKFVPSRASLAEFAKRKKKLKTHNEYHFCFPSLSPSCLRISLLFTYRLRKKENQVFK